MKKHQDWKKQCLKETFQQVIQIGLADHFDCENLENKTCKHTQCVPRIVALTVHTNRPQCACHILHISSCILMLLPQLFSKFIHVKNRVYQWNRQKNSLQYFWLWRHTQGRIIPQRYTTGNMSVICSL